MARKKKEKPLTLEEAVDLIKEEMKDVWIQSPPLIAAVSPEPDLPLQAYPLDASFRTKSWALLFMDPTSFERDYVLQFLLQINQRYSRMDFGLIIVFLPRYKAFEDATAVQLFIHRRKMGVPICIDVDFKLSKALGVTTSPAVVLLSKETSEVVAHKTGEPMFKNFEQELRNLLWKYDPGLAVPALFEIPPKTLFDTDSFDWVSTPDEKSKSSRLKVRTLGIWKAVGEAMVTEDPDATLEIEFTGTDLSIIGHSTSPVQLASRMYLNGDSIKKSNHGPDVTGEDSGSLVMRLEGPRRLYCVKDLMDQPHKISIRFPDTMKTPVAILGVRVGTNRP